jgi:acetyl-CoA acetyltransferase
MARLQGWGSATSPSPSRTAWLADPTVASARAAADAYRRAGRSSADISYLEMTDLTPSISDDLAAALQLGHLDVRSRNRSGGVRSNHPGIANGLLRIIEGAEQMRHGDPGELALVHTAGDLMGLTSSTSAVLVLEAL